MPLGMDVGLGPRNFVLHGNPPPPTTGHSLSPNFRPMSIVAKRSPISAQLLLSSCLIRTECGKFINGERNKPAFKYPRFYSAKYRCQSVSVSVMLQLTRCPIAAGRQQQHYHRIMRTDWRRLLPPASELKQPLASSHRIHRETPW